MERRRLVPLLLLWFPWACASPADDLPRDPLDRAIAAAGGKEAILSIRSQTIVATGRRFEPGQGRGPAAGPIDLGEFRYTLTQDVATDRLHVAWMRPTLLPGLSLSYAEVIDGDAGYFNGRDAIAAQADQAPMLSSRIAAVRKHRRLLSPHLLLRKAIERPGAVQLLPDAIYQGLPYTVVSLDDGFQPIRLFIHKSSHQIDKAETVEDDPIRGDAVIEAAFGEQVAVRGVSIPRLITVSLSGIPVLTEARDALTINGATDGALFSIPAPLQRPPSAADAARGEAIAEYLHRFAALGFPADADPSQKVVATRIGPGLHHLTGGSAHTLSIELAQGVVVVEAPADDARSQAVIAEIRRLHPEKPITHVINTHHHDDHAGGLRSYVAEGARIVTASGNEALLKAVFAAPHTLRPDALQLRPAAPALQLVGPTPAEITITDGSRRVRVFSFNSGHCDGMLLSYVEDARLIFVADLYSPGFFPPDQEIPGAFGLWAKELYKVLTTDLKLDVDTLVGAHGVGTATLSILRRNAGM